MAAEPHRQGAAHAKGWLISILLHGAIAVAAIFLMKQVQHTPDQEPFKWDVAMVSPVESAESTATPQNEDPVASVQSTTSIPSPPVRQTRMAQTSSPVQPPAQQAIASISEPTVTPDVTEPAEPTPPPATTPPQSATHLTQPEEPVRHESLSPTTAEPTSVVRPAEAPVAVPEDSDARYASSNTPSSIEPTARSEQASGPTQMAALSPSSTNALTKLDYGWLSETILRRVEELKRYPAAARMDRAEGKVVVKAVIHESGNVGDVEIFQSSGHPSLDSAAMETLRQAAPFPLSRPLGQLRMTIKIPMSYRLDH